MSQRTVRLATLAMATLGVAAWVCLAAPNLPKKSLVTDEIYSLGQLDKVKVELKVMSTLLTEEGLDEKAIEEDMANLLMAGGIDVVDKGDAIPTVSLVLLTNTDARFEDVVSVTHHISLEQPVLVRRLERDVVVPTYALVHGILVSKNRLVFDTRRPIPQIINHFLRRIDEANAVVERQELRDSIQ